MAKEEKTQLDKDMSDVLKLIHKKFGEESLLTFDNFQIKDIETISTGSLNLDMALGSGIPMGRISTIYGSPSSGKSTIAMQACAEAQKKGYLVAYLDSEHAVDLNYMRNLGVDLKHLLFAQPDKGTDCFAMAEELLRSEKVKLIVFDSVSTMLTDAEINGDISSNYIGRTAKLLSDGLKRITPLAMKANCACFFISQTRKDITKMFGDKDIMSGGEALKFYSSVIMKIWKKEAPITEKINGEELATSVETTVKVVKNKISAPYKTASFIIRYGEGVSQQEEVLDLALKFGIIERAGAWFRYKGENVAQGREKAMSWLKSNPELLQHFKETVISYITTKNKEMYSEEENFEDSALQSIEEDVKFDPETGEILE